MTTDLAFRANGAASQTMGGDQVLDHLSAQTTAITQKKNFPEPVLEVIIGMRNNEFSRFTKFHSQCEKAEQFYRGTVEPPHVEGGNMVIPTTAHTLIETFSDHIDTDHIQIDVRSGPRGQAAAEIRSKFFNGVIQHSGQESMFMYTASKHLALYGVAMLKRFHDADRWPERPEAPGIDGSEEEWTAFANELADFSEVRAINFPIVDDVINPKNAVWDISRGSPRWVIERYKMSQESVKKWFDDWQPTGQDEVEITEYWDSQWVAYLADDLWLMRPRWHGYHILPYVLVEPAMGVDAKDSPPEERYVGILTTAVENLLIEEARLISQYDTIVRRTAQPYIYFQGPPELVRMAQENWDENPGALNYIPDGVSVNVLNVGSAFQNILQVRSEIMKAIEDDTLPAVIRGAEPAHRSSGFEVTARAGMARLRLKAAAKALATGVQKLNIIAAMLLEHVIREPITVFAQTPSGIVEQRVKPKDVAGQYTSRVTLEAASPEDRQNRGMFGLKLYSGGMQSELMTRRDFLGQTNAIEDMMQTRAEQLMKSPEFQQTMLQMAGDTFAAFLQQQEQVAGSTGVGGIGNQFLGAADARAATTQVPDQARRVQDRLQQIQPGGLQDMDRRLSQFGTIGAGPLRTTAGMTIQPGGEATR